MPTRPFGPPVKSRLFRSWVLFPYARAAVSNLVTQGGFPQFLLPPVNFDALYASNQAQQPTTTN